MKKILTICAVLAVLSSVSQASVVTTIATFADPSTNSTNPLFMIDSDGKTIEGGWDDSKTNLNLKIVYANKIYYNAWFEMTTLTYGGSYSGTTSGGSVKFHADGDASTAIPILEITFSSATLSPSGMGATELFFTSSTVAISGSDITDQLSDESFAFSFANQASTPSNNGYTATASFTSSAVPEPATLALLSIGGLLVRKRKNV